MKNIFIKPLGDLRTLGTRREWISDAVGLVLFFVILLIAAIWS